MEKRDARVGERALAYVEEHLARHPHLQIERQPGRIIVCNDAEGGFQVEISDEGDEAIVWGGGWHDHYDDASEAAAAFMWLLTDAVRIVLRYRGKHLSGWRQERFENGYWVTVSRGRQLLPLPFWGKESEEILQNRLIERSPPETETS